MESYENDQNNSNESSLPGRRIVEIDFLASKLICDKCESLLHLKNFVRESRYDLGSIFYITCSMCYKLNAVPSGKQSSANWNSKRFDVMTKVAGAMIHIGVGPSHIVSFFNALNIPAPSERALKSAEREIGPCIEKIATVSCEKALANQENENSSYKFDAGWQKRSSGRSYNSKSGHSSLFNEDGDLVSFSVRSTSCRTCQIAEKNSKEPAKHDCRRNWSGSAKAMEASMGLENVENVKKQGHAVSSIVMDDDSTTLRRLQLDFDPNIVKYSDINHTVKNLTSMLYTAANDYKVLTSHKEGAIISHIKKCFSYAVHQNIKEPDKLAESIRIIPDHLSGIHGRCGTWCKAKENTNYIFKSLPKGKPLQDPALISKLKDILEIFAINAPKLAAGASTNVCENFNHIVASKAPKSRHYSSSESLFFRVAAAAAQKNSGHIYLNEAMTEAHLSPSKNFVKFATKRDSYKKIRQEKQCSKEGKLRRLQLKEINSKRLKTFHKAETDDYGPGISITESSGEGSDFPTFIAEPLLESFDTNIFKVFFDLEHSGCTDGQPASIIQISAHSSKVGEFNQYILPLSPITPYVQRLTRIKAIGDTLVYKDKAVPTISLPEGLSKFLNFIETHNSRVVLVSHNAKSCDSSILCSAICEVGLQARFSKLVEGFIDTLPLYKIAYPKLSKYSQSELCKEFLGTVYDAHNSLEDCKALSDLFSHLMTDQPTVNIDSCSFTVQSVIARNLWKAKQKENFGTFHSMIDKKYISHQMAMKCAGSGIRYHHLAETYKQKKLEGVTSLLSEYRNGKPRVTSTSSVIKKINEFFEKYLDIIA